MLLLKVGRGSMVVMGFGLVALVITELEFFSVASISFLFFNNDIQKSVASQKCASDGAHGVKGSEFSLVWPNFTDEVWNLPADGITTNGTDETIWHPSKFSDLCASHVNLSSSIHAPPLYRSMGRPSGLRLVMLGDSVTRYQFLMLIHFLHTGHWVHDSMRPFLLSDESFGRGDWRAFYSFIETYFEKEYMVCDCFRGNRWEKQKVENQFYRDKGCLDNSVSFFAKFGTWGFRGYHTASDINGWFQNSIGSYNDTKLSIPESVYEQANYTYHYPTYEPFLRNVVAKLEPRPRVVVINEGLWTDVNLSDEAVVIGIRDTIRDLGMVSVYRTTTKTRTGGKDAVAGLYPHDKLCCEIFDHCIRTDWTFCAERRDYLDQLHLLAYANLRLVEQLLDLLENLGDSVS
jgi:hypothetical protein